METTTNAKPIVLVAGASGLVGRACLDRLADDDRIGEVRALLRRPLSGASLAPKVRECLVDFERLDQHPEWFRADWVFCTLGTTMRLAGSRDAFRRVDFDFPLAIAKAALAGGARHFLLVSSAGANAGSRFFYTRVKGELEEAVLRLGYPSITMARPSLLLGKREKIRPGEAIAKCAGWLLPARWRPVAASRVAAALMNAATSGATGLQILENEALRATH